LVSLERHASRSDGKRIRGDWGTSALDWAGHVTGAGGSKREGGQHAKISQACNPTGKLERECHDGVLLTVAQMKKAANVRFNDLNRYAGGPAGMASELAVAP
jgi:hypothetical protein